MFESFDEEPLSNFQKQGGYLHSREARYKWMGGSPRLMRLIQPQLKIIYCYKKVCVSFFSVVLSIHFSLTFSYVILRYYHFLS